MAKYAKVVFKLLGQNVPVLVIRDALLALPSDAKVLGFNYAPNGGYDEMLVESSSFVDTPPSQNTPEIVVYFGVSSMSGKPYFDRLDMSAAMPKTAPAALVPWQGYTIPKPQAAPSPSLTFINNAINAGIFSIPSFGVDPGMEVKKVSSPTQGCNHEWKIYDSGFSRDEYCSKCPVKRSC